MRLYPIFFLILISAINQASAANVNYTQDRRYIFSLSNNGAGISSSATTYPSAPYADMAVPGQTSTLGPNGFSATGSGSAYSNFASARSESAFDISFSVANSMTMTLSGMLQGNDTLYGSGNASIFLYRGDNLLPANQLYGNGVQAQFGYQSADISYATLLSAGEYRLVATANPYYQQATSGFSVNASFTPVPVPAAVWLFGSGLLGLIGMTGKRRG